MLTGLPPPQSLTKYKVSKGPQFRWHFPKDSQSFQDINLKRRFCLRRTKICQLCVNMVANNFIRDQHNKVLLSWAWARIKMGACRPPLGLPPPPHGWNGDRDDHRQLSGCVAPAGPISPSLEFFLKFIYFIYLCLRWVFVAARGLSLVATSGGYSSLWCTGFLLWWLFLLQSTGSRPTGFSSCSTRAQ